MQHLDSGHITPPNVYINYVEIVNNNKAFIAGYQGTLLKSTDGGSTWVSVNSNTTGSLEKIVFKDLSNGLIIANAGPSIITTDGGENWNPINYNFGGLWDADLFGDDNIALSGSDGKIYISEDAGQTWTEKIVAGTGTYISGISFKDALNGTAVGETGLLLFTTDGGDTWHQQFTPTLMDLLGIKYSQNGCGIIIGKEGIILGTKKGIQIVGVDDEQLNLLPTNLYLFQNYPNPFNPSTSIQYAVNSRQFVTLKVYDMLGREIATLVNEEKEPGIYRAEFNTQRLSSCKRNIFVQNSSGQFVETKKMVLMK